MQQHISKCINDPCIEVIHSLTILVRNMRPITVTSHKPHMIFLFSAHHTIIPCYCKVALLGKCSKANVVDIHAMLILKDIHTQYMLSHIMFVLDNVASTSPLIFFYLWYVTITKEFCVLNLSSTQI